MNTILKVGGIAGIALLAAAVAPALIVRPATNLPSDPGNSIQAQPGTSSALGAVLDRSCGDCHSNTMAARWYTRFPPFSALMARGASEGRKAVNFSEWTGYSPEQQRALLLASCADAKRGTMPIEAYVRVRSDARPSAGDVETICAAARQAAPSTTAAGRKP
jgi:hypothetical protein